MNSSKNLPAGSKIVMISSTSNWSKDDFGTIVRWINDQRAFVTIDGQDGGDEYVAFKGDFVAFVPVK